MVVVPQRLIAKCAYLTRAAPLFDPMLNNTYTASVELSRKKRSKPKRGRISGALRSVWWSSNNAVTPTYVTARIRTRSLTRSKLSISDLGRLIHLKAPPTFDGMATPVAVSELLNQHSGNVAHDTFYMSSSSKHWARHYRPIEKLKVHTYKNQNQGVSADYDDAFLELYEDEELRMQELAYPPNYRTWRLAYEEDGVNWFNTEVSNVVLAAWARYPNVLQTSQEKPLTDVNISESVDIAYSVTKDGNRMHMAIGEFKRCLIKAKEWENGSLGSNQRGFSQELRG